MSEALSRIYALNCAQIYRKTLEDYSFHSTVATMYPTYIQSRVHSRHPLQHKEF
jgi:hypothetical protein